MSHTLRGCCTYILCPMLVETSAPAIVRVQVQVWFTHAGAPSPPIRRGTVISAPLTARQGSHFRNLRKGGKIIGIRALVFECWPFQHPLSVLRAGSTGATLAIVSAASAAVIVVIRTDDFIEFPSHH